MTRLHVRIGPSAGPPLVLLHGIPGSSASWLDVASRLEPCTQTIVPDLLGFGESPGYRAGGHALEQAEAVLETLAALGIAGFHLAGFDFGGPVAVALHARAPERIRSITLAATNVFTDTPVPPPLRLARVPLLGELLFDAMFSRAGLSLMWSAATARKDAFPRERFFREIGGENGRRTARHVFLSSLRNLRGLYADIEAALPGIAVPAAVVWGDRDPFFPVESGRRTHAAIGGSRLEVLRDCGHFVPSERPGEVARILEETVARGEDYDSRSSKMAKSR